MISCSSVGKTTSSCSLSDQLKQYKRRSLVGEDSKVFEESNSSIDSNSSKRILSLTTMCLNTIGKHFNEIPYMENLPKKFHSEVIRRLPLDLSILVSGSSIFDENYWKKCCLHQKEWSNRQIMDHGLTWKQMYFELSLQNKLETFDPNTESMQELLELLAASQDSVFFLKIRQLSSSLELDTIFNLLPNLTLLDLTFGVEKVGMKYENMQFGMRMSDATSLSQYFKTTTMLTVLKLSNNLMDDDLLQVLMQGLVHNHTITHLDFSHNKIGSQGVRLLAKLLGENCVLTSLNLCDNQIQLDGGVYLGRALRHNSTLVELNLRLNRITDAGGAALMEGIHEHSTLTKLNLSSNSIASETSHSLCRLLHAGISSLKVLDLTGNCLVQDDLVHLCKSIEANKTICCLDLRKNQFPNDLEILQTIEAIVRQNELDCKKLHSTF